MKYALMGVILLVSTHSIAQEPMTQKRMEGYVKSLSDEFRGEGGVVEFQLRGVLMYLISDTSHDRMRIISPIIEYPDLAEEVKDAMLKSNYSSALDARYAVSDGIVYSAFIHPLSTLNESQLQYAVAQVYNLNTTFGAEYSSGVLSFGDIKEGRGKGAGKKGLVN